MRVHESALFVAFVASATRQRRLLMNDVLELAGPPDINEANRSLPMDADAAVFHLAQHMAIQWKLDPHQAAAHAVPFWMRLWQQSPLPNLGSYALSIDPIAVRIAFLAAIGNRDWPRLQQLGPFFSSQGLRAVPDNAERANDMIEIALSDLETVFDEHYPAGGAQRRVDALRSRIETGGVTAELLDIAIAGINPS